MLVANLPSDLGQVPMYINLLNPGFCTVSQSMPDIVYFTAQDFDAFKVIHLFTFDIANIF